MGIRLLQFDYEKMIKKSRETPKWVHFGIGNIFRPFETIVKGWIESKVIEPEFLCYQ